MRGEYINALHSATDEPALCKPKERKKREKEQVCVRPVRQLAGVNRFRLSLSLSYSPSYFYLVFGPPDQQ